MNTPEDRVRQALREAAEDISWTDVPPLRLPDRAGRGRRARGWRSWPSWLTPLAAAAAVAAVLAATLALTGGPDRSSPHRTWQAALLASAARYYIVLHNPNSNLRADRVKQAERRKAQIRATATGRVVAKISPPPDSVFTMVATASGVGRYVLTAQRTAVQLQGNGANPRQVGPIRFYQLRISSSGQVSALSPLPVPALPADADVSGLALTPDGRKLAVAIRTGGPRPGPEIQVDTLATGAQRVWTWPGAPLFIERTSSSGSALSWAADDRTLAFASLGLSDARYKVRLLDTMAPGSSLAASRPALSLNVADRANNRRFSHGRAINNATSWGALLTPDGSKIVVATVTQSLHPVTSEFAFTEFSARTGKVVAVLGRWKLIRRWPDLGQAVLWTNADGSTLLILAHRPGVTLRPTSPGSGVQFSIEFGVLHGNRYTPLPDPPRLDQASSSFPVW
jgi:hypothetical protein